MKLAILKPVPPDILAWRRKTGADRWDEMWEGVLHMHPAPSLEHMRLQQALYRVVDDHVKSLGLGEVFFTLNVARPGRWPEDFRIPDLLFVAEGDRGRLKETHVEGGPRVVIEIRSPGDATYDKLDFWAEVGTEEVVIIDRDTKATEVFVRTGDRMSLAQTNDEGFSISKVQGIRFRACDAGLEVCPIGGSLKVI